jgi:DNA (cytosine-5)-methyltransferase 1
MGAIKYGSVCSGVEAATVAWHHLLVGGTPCQSFSVAGLRAGLADPRGNLALTYLAIADRYRPEWLVWENVPGVLSSGGGRDFGSFLSAGKNLAADAGTGAGRGSHWDALTNPHPSLNQSHNTGGIGASNQELFSQRESGIVPQTGYRMVAFGEYADDNTASAMKARDYKDATDLAVCATGDIAHTLKGEGHDGSEDGTGRGVPTIAHTVALRGRDGGNPPAVAHTLGTQCSSATEDGTGRGSPLVPSLMAVRRLTPVECERLQGFPDDYTLVPHRNKPAADGPRYKSLGNSMAVPVMRWIGERISKVESYDK